MRKTLKFGLILSAYLFSLTTMAAQVEVVLVDRLDGDLNNYCLDIVGGKLNAKPEDGLQAHTCYSYEGDLGIDQAMDSDLIAQGIFKIIGFDVCATAADGMAGSTVALSACNGSDNQNFELSANGNIKVPSAPGMCLTAGEETVLGNNGKSRHQIKTLTLETCSANRTAYQAWRTREAID